MKHKKLINQIFTILLIVGMVFSSVAIFNTIPTTNALDGWWDTDWTYRYLITLNNTLSSENLQNFTVRVSLDDSNFNFSHANPDGSDIRFVDIDGATELDFEVDRWSSTYLNEFPALDSWSGFNLRNTTDFRYNVHTWSMVETDDYLGGYKYWAYTFGWNTTDIAVSLVRSNSTTGDWEWYDDDPLFFDVERPTVLHVSDTEWYLWGYNTTTYNIDRYSSSDGLTWSWDETTVDPSDRERATNPCIKEYDDIYYLYYGAFNYLPPSINQSIRVRQAADIDDLSSAEPTELLNAEEDEFAIQFPCVTYFANKYWMLVEVIPTEVAGQWTIYSYYADTPDGEYVFDQQLMDPIEACPFIWLNDDNETALLYTTQTAGSYWDMGVRGFDIGGIDKGEFWVRVPQIDAESATDGFYVYCGNSEAESAEDAHNAWDSGFTAVYHFNNISPANISDPMGITDNELTSSGVPYVEFNQDAIIDGAVYADGDLGYFLTDDDNYDLDCTGDITVLFLGKVTDDDSEANLLAKKYNEANYPLYALSLEDDTGYPKWYVRHNTYTILKPETDCFDKWTFLAGVRNTTADELFIYINGTEGASGEDLSGQNDISNQGRLGILCAEWNGAVNSPANGYADEARVYQGILSPDWIEAENINLFGDWFYISSEQDILDYQDHITLSSPSDNYVAHTYAYNFTFTPVFPLTTPETAYFHTNATGWDIQIPIGDVENGTEYTYEFTFFQSGASYLWAIEVENTDSDSIWSDNRTITIGSIDYLDQYNYADEHHVIGIDSEQIYCQRYKPSLDAQSRIGFNISRYGTYEPLLFEIRSDSSGIPDLSESGLIVSESINYTEFATYNSYEWYYWDYEDFNNTADAYYWVVLKSNATGSSTYYVRIDIVGGYSDGYSYRSLDGGESYYLEYGYDLVFEEYGYDYVTATETSEDRDYIPESRYDDATIINLWGRSDTWTVNEQYGYKLDSQTDETSTYTEITTSSLVNFTVSLALYRVDENGFETIATDIADITKTSTGRELVDTIYETSNINWNPNDALMIKLLFSLNGSDPIVKGIFISEKLNTNTILAANWTVSYSLNIINNGGSYTYRMYFGDQTVSPAAMFKIGNFAYANLDIFGQGLFNLGEGDFIGFITNSFTFYLGDLFYGIMLMGFCIMGYNRYKSIKPIMVLCLLFGGVGGIVTGLIPAIGLNISFLFLAVGVAIALYKLVR